MGSRICIVDYIVLLFVLSVLLWHTPSLANACTGGFVDGFDADCTICNCLFAVVLKQLVIGDVAMAFHAAHHQLGCVQRLGHVLGFVWCAHFAVYLVQHVDVWRADFAVYSGGGVHECAVNRQCDDHLWLCVGGLDADGVGRLLANAPTAR